MFTRERHDERRPAPGTAEGGEAVLGSATVQEGAEPLFHFRSERAEARGETGRVDPDELIEVIPNDGEEAGTLMETGLVEPSPTAR